MTWQKHADERVTSPMVSPRRSKSARELYRPAIKDLSSQASWATGEIDDPSLMSSVSPSFGYSKIEEGYHLPPRPPSYGYSKVEEGYHPPTRPDSQQADMTATQIEFTKLSPPVCYPVRKITIDDSFRNNRLTYSASSRLRLLNTFKRPRSVDAFLHSPSSIPYPDVQRDYRQFVVRNNTNSWQDCSPHTVIKPLFLERDVTTVTDSDKKLNLRPLIRGSTQSGCLLSDGSKGQTNGFHEHLVNTHPKIKQQLAIWLTNGFKVQSLRLKNISRKPTCKTPSTGRLHKLNDRKSANVTQRITMTLPMGHNDALSTEDPKDSCHLCELKIIPTYSTSKYNDNLKQSDD